MTWKIVHTFKGVETLNKEFLVIWSMKGILKKENFRIKLMTFPSVLYYLTKSL